MKTFASLLALSALTLQAPSFEALDARIEQVMKAGGVPGAAIVVVKDGAVVHARGFGVASVETNVAVTTRTLFRLGSTTKLFDAVATLRLVQDGHIRLDQPVGELVPGLTSALQRVTIEQLLTHTSGLADDAPMAGPLEESALHARVTKWGDEAFVATPGEIFSYANPGYVLLGDVIAQTSGQPFSAAMKSLVLDPMGMHDSTFLPLEAFTRPVALGHDGNGVIRPFAEHAGNYPPGSLFTNADDLGRFLVALSANTLETLAKPRASIRAQGRDYGYGLITDMRRGPRLVLHTGSRSGYGSIILMAPDAHVAVAVVTNRTGVTMSEAAFAAIAPYVKVTEVTPPTTAVPLAREDLLSLVGTYTNGTLPVVELADGGGHLVVRVGGRTLDAVAVGTDRFHVPRGGQLEDFVIARDAQGAPTFLCVDAWALRKRR